MNIGKTKQRDRESGQRDRHIQCTSFCKEHGSLPNHIARTLTARRICLGRSKSSILI